MSVRRSPLVDLAIVAGEALGQDRAEGALYALDLDGRGLIYFGVNLTPEVDALGLRPSTLTLFRRRASIMRALLVLGVHGGGQGRHGCPSPRQITGALRAVILLYGDAEQIARACALSADLGPRLVGLSPTAVA